MGIKKIKQVKVSVLKFASDWKWVGLKPKTKQNPQNLEQQRAETGLIAEVEESNAEWKKTLE